MESELKIALLELASASPSALIRCMPQLFDLLISLLVRPPTLPTQPINIAATVFEAIGLLVKKITNLPDGQVDVHNRHALLATYTAYQCTIPSFSAASRGVVRAQSNPDLPIEDIEMEIHSRGLGRATSMRQEAPLLHSHQSRRLLHEELVFQWVVNVNQARELVMTYSWQVHLHSIFSIEKYGIMFFYFWRERNIPEKHVRIGAM